MNKIESIESISSIASIDRKMTAIWAMLLLSLLGFYSSAAVADGLTEGAEIQVLFLPGATSGEVVLRDRVECLAERAQQNQQGVEGPDPCPPLTLTLNKKVAVFDKRSGISQAVNFEELLKWRRFYGAATFATQGENDDNEDGNTVVVATHALKLIRTRDPLPPEPEAPPSTGDERVTAEDVAANEAEQAQIGGDDHE